jgi:aryl-alcohol dehydrogenase-like predicted oxidoreductase
LPVVGIGTAVVFDIGDDTVKRAERTAVIRTMVEGGARLIDTAPSYGTAEDVVGDLLAATNLRDQVFLATKVRVANRDETLAEMNRSLVRLKTSKVDLVQIHNVKDANTNLNVLREWRGQGRTRYIGITNSNPATYEALAEVVRREKPDFLQVAYSMSDRQAEERLLPTARDAGTAVLTALPFGRNKLFAAVRGKPLPDWAAEIGAASWAQVFLKYLISNEAVNCVIPGTDKPEYMIDNMNAGRGKLPDAVMRKKMLAYWETLR